MYVRLNRFVDMEADALAASLEWFSKEGLPPLRRAATFQTIFFGVDLDAGKAAGITFWETERGLTLGESVEGPLRKEALRRAGGVMSHGLVDTYNVWLAEQRFVDEPLYARLFRWEGLTPGLIRSSFDYFRDVELPRWDSLPGFGGIFMAANVHLGNTLSVALWAESEVETAQELELEARNHLEAQTHGRMRPIIADTYRVALAPELRALAEV